MRLLFYPPILMLAVFAPAALAYRPVAPASRLESRAAPGVWLVLFALAGLVVIEWRRKSLN